jgi:hypothetical protein
MSPQSGASISAHIEATAASPSAKADSGAVPVEQFIWENAAAPAESVASEGDERDDQAPTSEASDDSEEALTRIVVLFEDEEETPNSWRRQLISALRDADRDASLTNACLSEPQPIPPVDRPRRPPNALVTSHAARTTTPPPVERRPRHRMTPVLLGISAAAGLLTITLPRAANTPETAAAATASEAVVTGSLVPAAGEGELKPAFVNSPVLVREGMSHGPEAALPVGPVIETVRTVPVQIGTRPVADTQMSDVAAPAIAQPAAPLASAQPSPTPAPPLDHGRLAALIYDEPAAPPKPSAIAAPPPAPAPVGPAEKAAVAPPEATKKPAKARNPQVSTAYQRSIRETPRTKKRASKKHTPAKTASRSSDRAKWDTRRQGLRTTEVKEVEPSTMVKLLKSLNPFASKEESQARPKKNIFE